MMRSLSSAVGGLRAHQTRMDVIGNNIANVNTYGFKSSRVTFSDVYYQTLSGGSSPNPIQQGGTNPTQIGYGSMVASIDVLNSPSAAASTDRSLDIYIAGDGMIITKDTDGNLQYSRMGVLGFDAKGYLVDVNGNYVMGFPKKADGTLDINSDGTIDAGALTEIYAEPEMLDQLTDISIGTKGEVTGLLPGDMKVTENTALPAWLKRLVVADDTHLSGDIFVAVQERSTYPPTAAMPANWITNVEAAIDSGVTGTYEFIYNHDTGTVSARNTANGATYTGSYVRGGECVLKDGGGNVMMTVTTDNLTTPPTVSNDQVFGTLTFTKQTVMVATATDKGGNTHVSDPITVNKSVPSYTFWPNTDYTLTVECDFSNQNVDSDLVASISFNYQLASPTPPPAPPANSGFNYTWVKGAYLNSGSTLPSGGVALTAGTKYVATTNINGSTYQHLNWISQSGQTLMNDRLERWAQAQVPTPYTGDFVFRIVETSPNVQLFIETEGGTAVAQTASFLNNGTVNPVNMVFNTITPAADQTIALTNGANPIGVALNDATYTFGNVGTQELIAAYDGGGNLIGQTVFNGGSTITLGDLTLTIDPDDLRGKIAGGLMFDRRTPPTGTTGNWLSLGSISATNVDNYNLDGTKKAGTAKADTSELVVIGNLALANFANAMALEQKGNSYFVESANSGEGVYGRPGTNGTGQLSAGYLEQSNVDISKEFTDMITTQRGFQANTRIITVSDEMLAELVNLKR